MPRILQQQVLIWLADVLASPAPNAARNLIGAQFCMGGIKEALQGGAGKMLRYCNSVGNKIINVKKPPESEH